MKKVLARWSLFSLVLLAVSLAAGYRFFPLQIRELRDRTTAWSLGLRPIRSAGGLSGYERPAPTAGARCVVLLHGIGDASRTWFKLLERLAARPSPEALQERLVIWELPGHGHSRVPAPTLEGNEELRPKAMAEQIAQATRELGCQGKSQWVGNSLGGWVAAWVALLHPEQVKGLLLLAPAGLASQARHPAMTDLKPLLETPTVESLQEFRARAYAKPQSPYPSWFWEAALQAARASSIRRVRESAKPEDLLDTRLGQVLVPTVILWGRGDRILPLAASRDFAGLARPGITTFREIDDCGHLPQKECPDAVLEALGDLGNF